MKVPEQITKAGLQIQKLNCGGLQIRRNWIHIPTTRITPENTHLNKVY